MVTFKELFSSAYFWQLYMHLLLQYSVLLNPTVFQRGDGILEAEGDLSLGDPITGAIAGEGESDRHSAHLQCHHRHSGHSPLAEPHTRNRASRCGGL
jgi:hypothetical protein